MMKGNDDIHSLLAWAIDKELEAHNKSHNCRDTCHNIECDQDDGFCISSSCNYTGREQAFHEMVEKIQNMRSNQRPHVRSDP